jgi:NADPH:quinone reductase-like Zn-dependent oxidoreductase
MRAVQIQALNQIAIADVPAPVPAAGEVLISLRAAALNHRDVWIKLGQYAGLKYPCIPGSDGAGVIAAVGAQVDPSWKGREVVINPAFNWGNSELAQGAGFSILGLPRDGTLAEQIAVPVEQVSLKPASLSWEEAAALPLAGLTAWRALITRAELHAGERVLISGIGGGVALFALQFAVAHGADVWVTSSSPEKIARAVALGAKGGANYSEPDWAARLAKAAGDFNVVFDSAGGPGFESLIELTAPGGRVVFFGATRGNPPVLPMRKIFWRQISLLGSTMGSPSDWQAMLQYYEQHHLKPVISDVIPFDRATDAFDLMERSGQFGKIVIRMG